MAGRLEGKIAIITGAGCVGPGWGNGRAACVRFAQEGAKIFAVDLRADTMAETCARTREAGGEIETYLCDVTDRAAVETMVAACQKHGKHPGMGGVYNTDLMKKYIDIGARLILSGSEMAFMMSGAKAQASSVRGLL